MTPLDEEFALMAMYLLEKQVDLNQDLADAHTLIQAMWHGTGRDRAKEVLARQQALLTIESAAAGEFAPDEDHHGD